MKIGVRLVVWYWLTAFACRAATRVRAAVRRPGRERVAYAVGRRKGRLSVLQEGSPEYMRQERLVHGLGATQIMARDARRAEAGSRWSKYPKHYWYGAPSLFKVIDEDERNGLT